MSASAEVCGGESIASAAGNPELISRLNGFHSVLRKTFEHISNKGRRVTSNELLVIFRTGSIPCRTVPAASLFVGLRYTPASSKTGGGDGTVLLC
jgi:hypothetical protein